MNNKPKYIIVHHTAVSYDKNPDQFEATDRYHKSKGWGMIGYHYEIAKNGKLYKGRPENMVGAHTKQKGMNYKSIGIVLDGNFDKEYPTENQTASLKSLIKELSIKYNIPKENIYPHRKFATYKSCYGKNLKYDWARNLLEESMADPLFAKKWKGYFPIESRNGNKKGSGKVYFVTQKGKKIYLPASMSVKKFAEKYKDDVLIGMTKKDIERIPNY